MSDLPDPQNRTDPLDQDPAPPPADKKIVFGARKPTEEAAPLTGIPLIIEAPFPFERTLQWLPEDFAGEKKTESETKSDESVNGNTAVVVSQEVLIKVNEHVSQTLDRELGGFLLGNRYRCPNTSCDYVIIDQFSPAKFTESTQVRLAFTHEAWAQLSDELSGKFLGKLLIGWYHSHPRMDVFLSSHDMEIQTERFPEPWMVALVLEPEKHLGGFFCSRDGRIKPNSPVDFFELLERNSRNSVIAWDNYNALDPSTDSTPVLSATNTANPTEPPAQELSEVRSKQKVSTKRKRRKRFIGPAILIVLLGTVVAGIANRNRVTTWLENRTGGVTATVPPQPIPTVEPVVVQKQSEPIQDASPEQPAASTIAPSPEQVTPTPESPPHELADGKQAAQSDQQVRPAKQAPTPRRGKTARSNRRRQGNPALK